MKKRLLSLFLVLCMALSLLPGLGTDANAEGIADLFGKYFTDESVTKLFGREVAHGWCGKGGQANVMYKIYEVTNPTVINDNPFLQELFTQYDYRDDVQYYGVYIYGSGEMEDYTNSVDVIGTGEKAQESPWSSHHYLLDDGTEADLKATLAVAYIEGANPDKNFTGVTNVGARSFDSIRYLGACYLGDTVKTIGKRAFEKVEYLGAVNMPRSLEIIGDAAFYGCNSLTFLRAGSCSKLRTISDHAFYSCTMLATLELPMGLTEIGPYAFAWCRILGETTLTLPTSLKKIGEGAFAFCTHFKRLNVPKSVTSIGKWAFLCAYDMSGLTFTPGGSDWLTIGEAAFAGCRTLTDVTFDARVRAVNAGAFAACERLETAVFGEALNVLGERAFTSLTEAGRTAIQALIDAFGLESPGDYTEAELTAIFNGLTGITPLKKAACTGAPPSVVSPADDVTRSFPADCVVHYPQEGAAHHYEWTAQLTKDGRWQGYQTDLWCGHFHEFEETVVAPTCTHDGYTRHTCTVSGCGYYYDGETVPALGHDAELVRTVPPSCTQDGAEFYHCRRAGCEDEYYTVTLPAAGHDESGCKRVEPTCTESGLVTGTCAVCGAKIHRVLPATGHDTTYMTVVKEATCTEAGQLQGWCAVCGQNVVVAVPALGHDVSRMTCTEPSCTGSGSRDGTCQRCGQIVHEVIPALGHSYVETGRVEPTSTTEGSVTYTCTRCGASKTEMLPCTACTGGADCPGRQFRDMPRPGDWAHEGIDYCVANGLMNGMSATTFVPGGTTNRAMVVTILWRQAGSPTEDASGQYVYTKLRCPFADVKRNDYYFAALMWAQFEGIVTGKTATMFDPNGAITREQMAAILLRYTQKYAPEQAEARAELSGFPDVQRVSPYAREAMSWAYACGYITGTAKGGAVYLDPQGLATRAQTATILARYCQSL